MSDSAAHEPCRLDAAAVEAVLRRLATQASPPWLHQEVARRMAQRLDLVRLQPERIIDWWSFLGASGELLARAYPKAERLLIEPNAALAARSRDAHRAAWWSPRRVFGEAVRVQHDSEPVQSPGQLLWANMMLHAVQDPRRLMSRWQQALSADGFVMFSCLGPDTVRELRDLYACLGWPAPSIEFIDMHDLGDMLVHAGFADPVMDQETLTLSWRDAPSLVAELRTLGGNVSSGRMAGMRTPRWRERLEQALQSLAGEDGRLALRFEIAYGHAFKALPRVKQGEPTTVSVDEMRALMRSRRQRHEDTR